MSKQDPKALRELRKAAGLSQEELARRAGVGLRFIRELEQGRRNPSLAKIEQVLPKIKSSLMGEEATAEPGQHVKGLLWRVGDEPSGQVGIFHDPPLECFNLRETGKLLVADEIPKDALEEQPGNNSRLLSKSP